jgi:hypothetical protein
MTAKALNPWPWETPEPGVYFNMDFEHAYLPAACLSSTMNKKLLLSITNFYSNAWFNPLRDVFDLDKDTQDKLEGRAYHKRILEGKRAFYETYAPDYEDLGDPKILRTSADLSTALVRIGRSFSGSKAALSARLLAANPAAQILDNLIKKHRDSFPDREFLPAKTIRLIELSAAMIEHHPDLRGWLAGGYPEVSIIWDDPAHKVRYKIRVDYLKIKQGLDLKTFANVLEQDINVAIRKTIHNRKYDLQAWLYIRGIEAARKMVAQGKVFGAEKVDPAWLKAFAQAHTEDYRFLFMQKKSPVARGKWFSVNDPKFNEKGEYVQEAARRFRSAYETFGEGAWIDYEPPSILTFDEVY